ncbi:Eco29kI family restriction endonuclease [Nocardia asiatica]|uniref:Eco29kI family restriction endonuclease n=1 Tax=Nocardia asiatica TaxID=209252 RepID=UPI003EE3A687
MSGRAGMVKQDDKGKASADFKLSITKALADQLETKLMELTPAPLEAKPMESVEKLSGVYQLYLNGDLMYVGKAARDLRTRLAKHGEKLSGRQNIDLESVTYACLYVDEDMDAAAPEKLLIKRYKEKGLAPWNSMGFGNRDPGRNRDTTMVEVKHFDAQYPIDTSLRIDRLESGEQQLVPALRLVKRALPYNFRFHFVEKSPHPELQKTRVEIPDQKLTIVDFLPLIVEALPTGWQATELPGYVILYKESVEYDSAVRYWRKTDGAVHQFEGKHEFDPDKEVEDQPDNED